MAVAHYLRYRSTRSLHRVIKSVIGAGVLLYMIASVYERHTLAVFLRFGSDHFARVQFAKNQVLPKTVGHRVRS